MTDLTDHVAKDHDLDIHCEEFSWKTARKNFQQSAQELPPQKEKIYKPRAPSAYSSLDDSSTSSKSQRRQYKKSALKRNMARMDSDKQNLQKSSKILDTDLKNIEYP